MKKVPSYPKILNLGAAYTEDALLGTLVVQEKVDGSLFAFGVNDEGQLVIRSKNADIDPEVGQDMFQKAIDYVKSLNLPERGLRDVYFYCEYLQKPKHNVCVYEKTPANHLVLFDVMTHGRFYSGGDIVQHLQEVAGWAMDLGIDPIPVYTVGKLDKDDLQQYFQKDSYLGGTKIEGIVIKNFARNIMYNGQVYPLYTKFVRPEYREQSKELWEPGENKLDAYIETFHNENRWKKVMQHAKEAGQLTHTPKDIGNLIPLIYEDVLLEEAENIKRFLFDYFKGDILNASKRGFAEWYKTQLLERLAPSVTPTGS